MRIKFILFLIFFISSPAWCDDSDWKFAVNPNNLEITAENVRDKSSLKITDEIKNLGHVTQLKIESNQAQWYYPEREMHVLVTLDARGLRFYFTTHKEQIFSWPSAGLSPQAKALVLPAEKELYIPIKDPAWLSQFKQSPNITLPSPFWAVQFNKQFITYLMPSSKRMSYLVQQDHGQLYIVSSHEFLNADYAPTYTVLIHFTEKSTVSPAFDYRQWLIEQSELVSHKEKVANNLQKPIKAIWMADGNRVCIVRQNSA